MTEKRVLTAPELEAYLKDPGNCPVCGEEHAVTVTGSMDTDGRTATQPVECDNCKSNWLDVYTLSGVEDIEIGEKYVERDYP